MLKYKVLINVLKRKKGNMHVHDDKYTYADRFVIYEKVSIKDHYYIFYIIH